MHYTYNVVVIVVVEINFNSIQFNMVVQSPVRCHINNTGGHSPVIDCGDASLAECDLDKALNDFLVFLVGFESRQLTHECLKHVTQDVHSCQHSHIKDILCMS